MVSTPYYALVLSFSVGFVCALVFPAKESPDFRGLWFGCCSDGWFSLLPFLSC